MSGYIIALLGLIASAFGVYVAASFTLAQKQLLAATRLMGYHHYRRWVLDSNAYSVFFLGETWDKEEQAILQRGGSTKELVALSDEKRNICEQAVQAVNNSEAAPSVDFAAVTEAISRLSKTDIESMLETVKVGRQNILIGYTFITDEEATYMGVYVATIAIALKMGIVELIDGLAFVFARNVHIEGSPDPKAFMADFLKLLWRCMNVARDYNKLLRACQTFTDSSVVKLTWRNIRQGSRISRR